jgi:hypothetical protein
LSVDRDQYFLANVFVPTPRPRSEEFIDSLLIQPNHAGGILMCRSHRLEQHDLSPLLVHRFEFWSTGWNLQSSRALQFWSP